MLFAIIQWCVIGLAMTLVTFILPYRRDARGLWITVLECVGGGFLGGLVVYLATLDLGRAPLGACLGGIVPAFVHRFVWMRMHPRIVKRKDQEPRPRST